MAKIPNTDKKYSQPNNSDLFGNIYYSKNLNFDEEGYIKLSPRAVSLVNSEDNTDFNIPVAFGRKQTGEFEVATTEDPFEIQINDGQGIEANLDDDNDDDAPPAFDFDSHGKWWQNRWYVTDATLLMYKTLSGGNWTDTAISLTSAVRHPLEVFRNRVTMCVGNGNVVKQINTSHSETTNLTLPAEFQVTSLAYNNNRMAVATKMADTTSGVTGINSEAYFFVWDGTTSSAGQLFGVGSDFIVHVVPYKSSFLLLTRTGLGLYFNGGGFDPLFELPVYFTDAVWGDSVNPETLGDTMVVDGDIVYININNATERYGRKGEEVLPNAPGGVMCYDPKVGLYHRWSPSISKAYRVTVATSGTNTSTNVLTASAGTIASTGSPVKYIYNPGDKIGGLTIGKVYYCIKLTSSTFQLAETRQEAMNGVAIDLTSAASSNNYFLHVELKDYGASYMQRTGAVALSEVPDLALDSIVFGGEYQDSATTGGIEHLCFTVKEFQNIGYYVTPKITSQTVLDTYKNGFIRHFPLKDEEYIEVKMKTKEYVGLPVTTPQHGDHCTWSGTNELYTSADLAEAKAYLDAGGELECEITAGAGAGQMAQILSMGFGNDTYSLVLDEEIEGVEAGDICDVLIENWQKLYRITSTEQKQGYSEVATGENNKSTGAKFKVIMKGSDIKIEETNLPNEPYKGTT